jgi:hypothetical protein
MTATSINERLAVLEAEVARLKKCLEPEQVQSPVPWWDKIFGTFANSTEYDEAMRLGREWREAQSMEYDEDTAAGTEEKHGSA